MRKAEVMTRDEIAKMRGEEPDGFNWLVWRNVMGGKVEFQPRHTPPPEKYNGPLLYASDPAADYSVLKLVRETWTKDMKNAFQTSMNVLFSTRPPNVYFLHYLPGDFAHAALIVRLESEGGK